mmetsp:Transcript_6978/g.14459  ORF Transcript_6978/g.14459 Transcript_6978/m.14459 type:complete len:140 (-) Transcript_6978:1495-1914(-)
MTPRGEEFDDASGMGSEGPTKGMETSSGGALPCIHHGEVMEGDESQGTLSVEHVIDVFRDCMMQHILVDLRTAMETSSSNLELRGREVRGLLRSQTRYLEEQMESLHALVNGLQSSLWFLMKTGTSVDDGGEEPSEPRG